MKTLVTDAAGVLSIRETPMPEIEAYQALCKVLGSGVCNGTDMKIIHGKFKGIDRYPTMLGHEAVGEVVKLGEKVTRFKIGDRVLLPFVERPADGLFSNWGGYAEYAVVGDYAAAAACGQGKETPGYNESYYAQTLVPPSIDPVDAVMLVTFREVLLGIRRFGMRPNDTVLIFGAGPVGLCFTKFCHILGLKTVVTLDIVDSKIAEAQKEGAHFVFNAGRPDLNRALLAICPRGFDFIVDAVGNNQIINRAMPLLADGGKICVYGISPDMKMELDWSAAPYNWQLAFHQMPSKMDEYEAYAQILNWVSSGILKPSDYISNVVPFADILDAFRMVEEKSAAKKIVIRYDPV